MSAFAFLALCWIASDTDFESRKRHIRELLDREAFPAAAEEARALNRQWPDDIETYQLLAAAHLELGNYEEADHELQWMLDLRLGKADARGYTLLARFREITGDIDGAIEAMNLAFGRMPSDRPSMLAYLAHLYIADRKLALAAKILGELESSGVRAELLLAQGHREEALATLRELAKDGNPRHFYRLAVVSEKPEDYQAFEHAAKHSSINAKRELALYLAGPGRRPAEALELIRREAGQRHDVFTQDALAFTLKANGHREEARTIMRSVLAVGTVDAGILAHAAGLGLKPE